MASTGFTAFGTATHVAGPGIDWSDPANALTDDTSAASFLPAAFGTSDKLRFTDLSATVPATATIDGLEFRYRRNCANVLTVTDDSANLYDDGTTGDDKAAFATWEVAPTLKTFGGVSDLHGLTLTPADVNGANFGFEFTGTSGFGFPSADLARVEFAEINVHFTDVSPPTTSIGIAWAIGTWVVASWGVGVWAAKTAATEPRGSTPEDQRHRNYDFGEHYPGLRQEDKDRIDGIIAALTPAAEKRLANARPSKTLRKKIAKVLPEYAIYRPKTSAEYRTEAEDDMATRLRERTDRLIAEDEEALLVVLMLAQ